MSEEQNSQQIVVVSQSNTIGILAIVFAILGIFFLGIIFVPLALLLSLIALYQAFKKKASWVVSIIAIILTIVGFVTSPALWVALGIGGVVSSAATTSRSDAEISKASSNVVTVISDLSAYYIMNAKFSDDFSKMTFIDLEKISNTEAFLLTKKKKCIKISLGDKKIIAEKGVDSDDEFCKRLYETKDIKNILETKIIEMQN